MSNVVYQAEILDSRGYETNGSGEREDVRRRLCLAKEGCRQTLAGCGDYKLGDCPRSGENCGKGDFGSKEEISGCLHFGGSLKGIRDQRVGIDERGLALP